MELTPSPRHTRRGFLRGDSAPKFFPVALKVSANKPIDDIFLPPSSPPAQIASTTEFPPPPHVVAEAADASMMPAATDDAMFLSLEHSLSGDSGNAFLSWLAEQLEGKNQDEFDPYLELGEQSLFAASSDDDESDETGCAFEAVYADADVVPAFVSPLPLWHRETPDVLLSPDGWRIECYGGGSKIVKDALGRVVEVHSHLGETMHFRYSANGHIESFQRIRRDGSSHSDGARDKHGVVVRDREGRVRAAGESMTIDPRGAFFIHTVEGQFFSVDLVSGIHTERRKLIDESGASRFVTSVFTHDGFRMATMFGGCKGSTAYGARTRTPKYRFYGRDGTQIEFVSEDDLQQLRPHRVSRPASRRMHKAWPHNRQARTAWDAVRDYLIRVG